jgi:molybdate transport system substrate-binding protein
MQINHSFIRRSIALIGISLALLAASAQAADITIVSSGGFAPALKALAPEFEKATGHTVHSAWGPSMGDTVNAIPKRLSRGESIDVVVMVGSALDDLLAQGKLQADSKVILARSKIAMAVRSGAAKPDISTVEALKKTLLNAKSIAYSDSASGVYLSTVLFPRLGIADQIKGKAKMIPADPVGAVVARGDFEIGFQQRSELAHVTGVDVVGLIPEEVQEVTLYSAAVVTNAKQAEAGRAFIKFLASPQAAAVINETGLEAATK